MQGSKRLISGRAKSAGRDYARRPNCHPVTGKYGQGCNLRRLIGNGDGEPEGLDKVLEPLYLN